MQTNHHGNDVEGNTLHVAVSLLLTRENLTARDGIAYVPGNCQLMHQPTRAHQGKCPAFISRNKPVNIYAPASAIISRCIIDSLMPLAVSILVCRCHSQSRKPVTDQTGMMMYIR